MKSISTYKKLVKFQVADLENEEAIGFYYSKNNRKIKVKFRFWITERGLPEIGKATTIKRKDYEAILDRVGKRIDCTFAQIKEMYSEDCLRVTSTA